MKRVVHILAAVTSLILWGALIAAMFMIGGFWLEILPYVIFCSVATMGGTILLARYWIRRKSIPSYGSILGVPFVCACLTGVALLIYEAWRCGEWYLLTFGYWNQAKGGYGGLIAPFGFFWFICLFPAAAIVIYFQAPHDTK